VARNFADNESKVKQYFEEV